MAAKTKAQQPADWKKTADALFRLARFHTLMGYCIFTCPASEFLLALLFTPMATHTLM